MREHDGSASFTTTTTTSSSDSSSSAPSTTTQAPTTTTPYSTRYPVTNQTLSRPTYSTDWPPQKTQPGQPSYCNNWHLVQAGQTCANIIAQYGTWMSADDFFAWNPSIAADCSGLYLYYWVCVGIRPQTSMSIPWVTGNATVEIPPYFTWTPTALPTDPPVLKPVPSPTQGPLPSNCNVFVKAGAGDTCTSILSVYKFVSQKQFFSWNPFLNDNCNGLWAGYYYCAMAFDSDNLPMPGTVTTRPAPVQTGIAGNCKAWYQMQEDDSCDLIAAMFGTFSHDDFKSWNPAVGSDCSGLKLNNWYCVGIPGTPTTRTSQVPVPTSQPTLKTQDGIAPDCGQFWLVSATDTCESITSQNSISMAQFLKWNPAIGKDACDNLLSDYYVCVGTGQGTGPSSTISSPATPTTSRASSTTPSSTPSTPSTTTAGAIATPSPVQAGMVSGCMRFYEVKTGDGCWAIANSAGTNLSDFYKWNPAVNNGGECAGLWPNYWVCIGLQ